MNITINKYKFPSFFIYVMFYRCILDFSYSTIVFSLYSYQGFQNNFSLLSEIVSLIVLYFFSVVIYYIYQNKKNAISNEILLVLFLMSFVPFTSMFGFGALQLSFVISNIIFWGFLLFFSTIPLKKIPINSTIGIFLKAGKHKLLNEKWLKTLTILFGLVVLCVSGIYTGFRLNFNLANVYELRESARNFHLPILIAYAFSWTRTINAIFIAYYMQKKEWIWAFLCFGIQLLNFGIDGSKTTLFLAVFAVIINLAPKFSLQRLNKWIVIGFLGTTFCCTVFYIFFSDILSISIWPVSLFVRRMMYLPVYISANYFDFFTTYSPDYYRQSFLRLLGFVSPYEDISNMLGMISFGTIVVANNGLISDAITNMGIVGIIITPGLYALILRILNRVSEGLDARIHLAVSVYIAVEFVNTFLFRVLLTHGLLIAMVILHFMSRDMRNYADNMVTNKG